MRPFILAFLGSALAAAAVVLVVTWGSLSKEAAEATRGWKLVPVLALSRNLPEGEALTDEALVDFQIPELFVSESTVAAADRALVVGQTPSFKLRMGDVLVWGVFAQSERRAVAECIEQLRDGVNLAGTRASAEAIERFEKRERAAPLPVREKDKPSVDGDAVEILVAAEDIAEGIVARKQLAVRRLSRRLLTASHIPSGALEAVAGASTVVRVTKGDPLLWQVLDDAEIPRSAMSCVSDARRARAAARKTFAADEAAAFLQAKGAP